MHPAPFRVQVHRLAHQVSVFCHVWLASTCSFFICTHLCLFGALGASSFGESNSGSSSNTGSMSCANSGASSSTGALGVSSSGSNSMSGSGSSSNSGSSSGAFSASVSGSNPMSGSGSSSNSGSSSGTFSALLSQNYFTRFLMNFDIRNTKYHNHKSYQLIRKLCCPLQCLI
jgi:hypothetical protein